MSKIVSAPGIEVTQKNFHQIIIRGNGLEVESPAVRK